MVDRANDMQKLNNAYLAISAVGMLFGCLFIPATGFTLDIEAWRDWATYILNEGLGNVYHSTTDYLPLYHYFLTAFGWLEHSPEAIAEHIRLLKLLSLIFHCWSGYLLARLLYWEGFPWRRAILFSLFYLLNPAVLYNFAIWGQVDGIMTAFVFMSFYAAWRDRPILSLVSAVLAINFKLQAVIFLPLIGGMLLPGMFRRGNPARWSAWVAAPVATQLLLLIPFAIAGTLPELYGVIAHSLGKYPSVSMNADNVWSFFLKGNLMEIPDSVRVAGLTYNTWGLMAFFTVSAVALWPLLQQLINALFRSGSQSGKTGLGLSALMAMGAAIPLSFFFLDTQMHERYVHPMFIFLIGHAILVRSPWFAIVAIAGCWAYLANLEAVLWWFHLGNYYSLIYKPPFVAALFLIVLVGLFVELYTKRPARQFRSAHAQPGST